ncbi:hypothetical protein, partial [Campylobacter jejuni]|uniref:hypothetical protein n=1 Tax=Campylobacter jejuni TaxID=197 RepID=UPI00352AD635
DLVVAWGASLNRWTTRNGSLIGNGHAVVQIDDRPEALGLHSAVDLKIAGDVAETARRALVQFASPNVGYRTAEVAELIAAAGDWRRVPYDDTST